MSNFIVALDAEINGLEDALARDPRYIKLQEVKRVRALYAATDAAAGVGSPVPAKLKVPEVNWVTQRVPQRQIMSGVSLEAINETRKLLSQGAKPILTREILDHLEGLGIKFGGASAQATLASILSRTPDFESKGGRVGWILKSVGPTGGETVSPVEPPVAIFPPSSPVEPEAGGGT